MKLATAINRLTTVVETSNKIECESRWRPRLLAYSGENPVIRGCLNKRAKRMMERFSANPTASIPDACDSWKETFAAYRFLGNADVDWEAILAPHWTRTEDRA